MNGLNMSGSVPGYPGLQWDRTLADFHIRYLKEKRR